MCLGVNPGDVVVLAADGRRTMSPGDRVDDVKKLVKITDTRWSAGAGNLPLKSAAPRTSWPSSTVNWDLVGMTSPRQRWRAPPSEYPPYRVGQGGLLHSHRQEGVAERLLDP